MTFLKNLTIKSIYIFIAVTCLIALCINWYLIYINRAVYVADSQVASTTPQFVEPFLEQKIVDGMNTHRPLSKKLTLADIGGGNALAQDAEKDFPDIAGYFFDKEWYVVDRKYVDIDHDGKDEQIVNFFGPYINHPTHGAAIIKDNVIIASLHIDDNKDTDGFLVFQNIHFRTDKDNNLIIDWTLPGPSMNEGLKGYSTFEFKDGRFVLVEDIGWKKHLQKLADDEAFKRGIMAAEAATTQTQFTGKETTAEVYNNPFIQHIRVGLNNYLLGNNKGVEDVLAMEASDFDPDCGLGKFDKSYYQSKFVIFDAIDGKMGGVEADIAFIDKPDKLFTVFVYKIGSNTDVYSIRGFCKVGPPADKSEDFSKNVKEKATAEKDYIL